MKEAHHQWENVWNGKGEILETISKKVRESDQGISTEKSSQAETIRGSQPEYNSDYIDDDY